MNGPRFAGLGRRGTGPTADLRAHEAAAPQPTPDEDPEGVEDDAEDEPSDHEKEPDQMTDSTDEKPKAEETKVNTASGDYKAGYAAANARMNTVFASEHFAGREAKAAKMLKTSATADEIVEILAEEPKATPEVDDSAAQGREMLDDLKGRRNADLGTTGDKDATTSKARADAVWDKARKANEQKEI